jgi:hypothetical protein
VVAISGSSPSEQIHAQVAQQGDSHHAADRADRGLLADVPRPEVRAADVEQAHGGHERQRDELDDGGGDLDRAMFLTRTG